MLFPWAERNDRELGGWVWTRSNFGLELWIGNNPDATGQTYFPQFYQLHPFGNPDEQAEYKRVGELTYMRQKGSIAKDWIVANPGAFLELSARRAVWFWFPTKPMVWFDGKKWVAHLYAALTLGMVAGVVGLFWTPHPHRWLFAVTVIGFSLPYLITHVDMRYRYPLNGVCLLLTCDVVIRVVTWLRAAFFLQHLKPVSIQRPTPVCSNGKL